MLSKMGYREGQGIGVAGQGCVEPVGLNLKASRAGLGIDEDRKRRKDWAQSQQAEKGAVLCDIERASRGGWWQRRALRGRDGMV